MILTAGWSDLGQKVNRLPTLSEWGGLEMPQECPNDEEGSGYLSSLLHFPCSVAIEQVSRQALASSIRAHFSFRAAG